MPWPDPATPGACWSRGYRPLREALDILGRKLHEPTGAGDFVVGAAFVAQDQPFITNAADGPSLTLAAAAEQGLSSIDAMSHIVLHEDPHHGSDSGYLARRQRAPHLSDGMACPGRLGPA